MSDTSKQVALTDPMLAPAIKVIEQAIQEHCTGGDLNLCAAIAAQKIVGEIFQEAVIRHTGCRPGPWKRMPPDLRAAIARASGMDETASAFLLKVAALSKAGGQS